MPSVSGKQQRAMFAAAKGKSTIGIPKKVGAEFAKPQGFNPPRSPVVAKRAANNAGKAGFGLKNIVADHNPMEKSADGDYP
jgi:hypothetical protein